jgi:short-subunit dehydrogenase
MPRFLWRSADEVAAASIAGLEDNRRVVIPGAPLRAAISVSRMAPRSLRLRFLSHALR